MSSIRLLYHTLRACLTSLSVRSLYQKLYGVVFRPAWSDSRWTVLLGYLTVSATLILAVIIHFVNGNFVFQQDSATPVHNTVQLLQRETLKFISPELYSPQSQSWTPLIQDLASHIGVRV